MDNKKMSKKTKARKVMHVALKVILSLLLISPVLGVAGIFPEPTRELYNTDKAFNFIQMMFQDASYLGYIIAIVFLVSIILLWIKREALSALLILPITVNIIGFHMFLDGGLFTSGALLANLLLVLNVYFIWVNRKQYSLLFKKSER